MPLVANSIASAKSGENRPLRIALSTACRETPQAAASRATEPCSRMAFSMGSSSMPAITPEVARVVNSPVPAQRAAPFRQSATMSYDLSELSGRVQYVMRECGYPDKASFARALGTSPQNVSKWLNTESIGNFGPRMRQVTGVSLDWLMLNDGDPFPQGPTLYEKSEASAGHGLEKRVRQLEHEVQALGYGFGALVASIIARTPDAGAHIVSAIRGMVPEKYFQDGPLQSALRMVEKARKKKTRRP